MKLIRFLLPALLLASSAATADQAEKIGVMFRLENYRTEEEVDDEIADLVSAGIKYISLTAKQDEDNPPYISGLAYYDSDIAPPAPQGWDVFGYFLEKAHEAGIKVWAWVPICHDMAAVRSHPEWAMVSHTTGVSKSWLCPRRREVRDYEKSIVEELISKYQLDGIAVDYVRYDDYGQCMCEVCSSEFLSRYGVPLSDVLSGRRPDLWDEFVGFREEAIVDFVEEIGG